MSQGSFSSSRGPGYRTGILAILIGSVILGITFGLIPTNPSSIHAPGWVLALFGGVFVVAGAWAVLRRALKQDTVEAHWINSLFALLVMAAVSVICLWVGFGPGQRVLVHTDPLTGRPTALLTDPTLARIFFGGFGILMSAATIAIMFLQGRKLLERRK